MAAAVLWRLAFPRVDLWPLCFVALTPLLVMSVRTTGFRAGVWAFLAGWAASAACVYWLRYTTFEGMLGLALLMGLYWTASVVVIRWTSMRTGWPLVVTTPPVWVAFEYLRSWLFTGFPWYFAGHALFLDRPLMQLADVTGVYGLSWLTVWVSALLADWVVCGFRPSRGRLLWTGVVAVALLLGHGYGALRLRQSAPRPGPWVALVQANVAQDIKNTPREGDDVKMFKDHVRLSLDTPGRADLVVWAETMMPFPVNWIFLRLDGYPRLKEWQKTALAGFGEIGRKTGAHMLIGTQTAEWTRAAAGSGGMRYCNSVYYLSPAVKQKGRYDKMSLVPFGEYVPLRDVFPFLQGLRPAVMGPELSPGAEATIFTLPWGEGERSRFGVTVCYEDAVAPLVRGFAAQGVEFMMNLTNDGWFRDSSELDMHLRICAFRAVEARRAFARSTNTGISSVIDATGRVVARLTRNGRDRDIEGTLTAQIPLDRMGSVYVVIGDAFAILASAWAGVLVVVAVWRGRISKRGEKPTSRDKPGKGRKRR